MHMANESESGNYRFVRKNFAYSISTNQSVVINNALSFHFKYGFKHVKVTLQ